MLVEKMIAPVPETTEAVARAAFPKGNRYMTMRDELGNIYKDDDYADLFSNLGQPALRPWRLALVTVMQYAENLTDRQAAEAVRARIDWKYALSLELTDPGFDFSVLSEFRKRLLEGEAEERLLKVMLEKFQARGLLKARGRQRTDATHVQAAIRCLNRLEMVGETLRHALNEIAGVAPAWLLEQVTPEWFDRYSKRFEAYRLPKKEKEQLALAETIGQDGYHLLACLYASDAPRELRRLSAVEILRQVWVQNYYSDPEGPHWRDKDNIPPPTKRISSPYDPQARYSVKREVFWLGYKAHFTETCDAEGPILITHVETTPATEQDVCTTERIQQALVEKDLPPCEHITDAGYVSSDLIVESQMQHDIELLGPVGRDQSWQALAGEGFDQTHFTIDWEAQTATCPQGRTSTAWYPHLNTLGDDTIRVRFHPADCQPCPARAKCTRSKSAGRTLTLLPKTRCLALQAARDYQKTQDFKTRYATRAGVEGTISQAVHTLHMRRARYIGLAKTHLQHLATAAAINLSRAIAWLWEVPRAQTTKSRFATLAP